MGSLRPLFVVVLLVLPLASPALAQDAPKPPARDLNRFDKLDPEIRKAADIDFSTVDLSQVDTRTKVMAGMALSDLLNVSRNKAEHRLDLSMGFLEDQKLTEDFQKADFPERNIEPLSFEDGQKLAVAYVTTDSGANDFAGKITTTDADMLGRMATAYDSMNRKAWGETVSLRRSVDRVARYLDSKGQFDAFMAWAQVEAKKQADAEEVDMQQRQIEYAKKLEQDRAARRQIAEANAQRQHEEKMKRLELSYQYKTEKMQAQRDVAVAYETRYQGNSWGWNDDYYRNNYHGRYTYRR